MWEKTHRPSQVYSTVFTLDDATLIVIDDLGKITWYAAATGAVRREIVRRRGSTASLMAGALSPDGATLAVGGSDHKVALYDIATGDLLHEITCSGWVWSLAFSPSGRMLAVGGDRHAQGPNLSLYDTGTNELLGEKSARTHAPYHSNSIPTTRFSPDGTSLIAGGMNQTLVFYSENHLNPPPGGVLY